MKGSVLRQVNMDMRCCRYCHYFKNGYCVNKDIEGGITTNHKSWFNAVCENGVVQEVITEALDEDKLKASLFNDIENAAIKHGMRSSKKSLDSFNKDLQDIYDIFIADVAPHLDKMLNTGIDFEADEDEVGFFIENPEEHCCCKWE